MDSLLIFLLFYILFNFLSFLAFSKDKANSKRGGWRIPERTLLTLSCLGIIGAILGMRIYHHKVNKQAFSVGLYLIAVVEVCILIGVILFNLL